MNKGVNMKKITALITICILGIPLIVNSANTNFAQTLEAEIESPGPQALKDLEWGKGTTPLVGVQVRRAGLPINVDTNTTAVPRNRA